MKNEEVRKWNVVLALAFRKRHVHVAMCTWYTWFEHVHVKEGPRDTGKKRIGISRSGGRVIVKTKVSKKGNGQRTEDGRRNGWRNW